MHTGAVKVLDQVIGHAKKGAAILSEEAELSPGFAEYGDLSFIRRMAPQCAEECHAADWVFAPSEYVRTTLIEIGVEPSRIILLPYGVNTGQFFPEPKTSQGPFRVLFMGQVTQRKGIRYLLEAYRRLNLPNSELIIMGSTAGSGTALGRYSDIFTHVSGVPYSELAQHYQRADIFVFPSLHEGSALVTYEAMACGLPVITTPNSGSWVRDGLDGFIVPIRDIDSLMERILRLYKDRDLRRFMSSNARIRAEQFTWQRYRRTLSGHMHEILGGDSLEPTRNETVQRATPN
jgi:glycosyltransferase involved in cell wall biosynthesis